MLQFFGLAVVTEKTTKISKKASMGCLVQKILDADNYHLFWKSASNSNMNCPLVQKLVIKQYCVFHSHIRNGLYEIAPL